MSERKTFAYKNPSTGLIEILDEKTGEVLAIQKSTEDLWHAKEERLMEVQGPNGPIYLEAGVSLDYVPKAGRKNRWPYSQVLADLICAEIANGSTVTKVGKTPGFPPYDVLCRWRREHPEFDEGIARAYVDRAHYYHDQAIETAENVRDEDEVPVAKLQVDTYKWAAKVGAPERFGERTTVTGKIETTSRIVIETGIRRPGDPGFEELQRAAEAVALEGARHVEEVDGMDTGHAGREGLPPGEGDADVLAPEVGGSAPDDEAD